MGMLSLDRLTVMMLLGDPGILNNLVRSVAKDEKV